MMSLLNSPILTTYVLPLVLLLLLARYTLSFVLPRITRTVRISSISPRSVRGIVVGPFRADRIGWGLASRAGGRRRAWVTFRVEGAEWKMGVGKGRKGKNKENKESGSGESPSSTVHPPLPARLLLKLSKSTLRLLPSVAQFLTLELHATRVLLPTGATLTLSRAAVSAHVDLSTTLLEAGETLSAGRARDAFRRVWADAEGTVKLTLVLEGLHVCPPDMSAQPAVSVPGASTLVAEARFGRSAGPLGWGEAKIGVEIAGVEADWERLRELQDALEQWTKKEKPRPSPINTNLERPSHRRTSLSPSVCSSASSSRTRRARKSAAAGPSPSEMLLRAFDSLSLTLSSATLTSHRHPALTLTASLHTLRIALRPSSVHTKRLPFLHGSAPASYSHIRPASLELSLAQAALDLASGETRPTARVLDLQALAVDAAGIWRPEGKAPSPQSLGEDPNFHAVVFEASLDRISGEGEWDALREAATAFLPLPRPRSSNPTKPTPRTLPNLPRLTACFALGDISYSLGLPSAGSILLRLPFTVLNASSTYRDHAGWRPRWEAKHAHRGSSASSRGAHPATHDATPEALPLAYEFAAALHTAPLSVSLLPASSTHRHRTPTPTPTHAQHLSSTPSVGSLASVASSQSETVEGLAVLDVGRCEMRVQGDVRGSVGSGGWARLRVGTEMWEASCAVESVRVELWRKEVLDMVRHVLASASAPSPAPTSPKPQPRPLLDRLPRGIALYASVGSVDVLLAGLDPSPSSPLLRLTRGVRLRTRLVAEYASLASPSSSDHTPRIRRRNLPFAQRPLLDLPEDIVVQALSTAVELEKTGGDSAVAKLTVADFILAPVLNASEDAQTELVRVHRRTSSLDAGGAPSSRSGAPQPRAWEYQERTWGGAGEREQQKRDIFYGTGGHKPSGALPKGRSDRHYIVRVPQAAGRLMVQRREGEPAAQTDVTTEAHALLVRFDLASAYSVMIALDTANGLLPPRPAAPRLIPKEHEVEEPEEPEEPEEDERGEKQTFGLRCEISDMQIIALFPLGSRLFTRLRLVELRHLPASSGGMSASWESLTIATPSPKVSGLWDELLRFRNWTVGAPRGVHVPTGDGPAQPVRLEGEGARVRFPHGFVLADLVFDVKCTAKAVKQLGRVLRGGSLHAPEPEAEGPKRVPAVQLKVGIVTVEAQDDPIETRLNLIWRAGSEEQRGRLDRDAAFERKVAAIRAAKKDPLFASTYAVPVLEAREQLDLYNAASWIRRIRAAKEEQRRREEDVVRRIQGRSAPYRPEQRKPPIHMLPPDRAAPLVRMTLRAVDLAISGPSFPVSHVPKFLHDFAGGVPHDQEYSLLIPLRLRWAMASAKVTLRDYPIPLLHIPSVDGTETATAPAWDLQTDLVIFEELSPGGASTHWHDVQILPTGAGHRHSPEMVVRVPKTVMPVKTATNPVINVKSSQPVVVFTHGASIMPAVQDVQRVIESFTHPPSDPSERVGFWDKLRLVCHWHCLFNFTGTGDVQVNLKGSRDPYAITSNGAGFVLCFRGNASLSIGLPNPEDELVQVRGDELVIAIPDLKRHVDIAALGTLRPGEAHAGMHRHVHGTDSPIDAGEDDDRFQKVCAKFQNGVRMGFSFLFERTCGPECEKCTASSFHRQCRLFDFKPHWEVALLAAEHAKVKPGIAFDSYSGFRSDFIHFGLSVVSPTRPADGLGSTGYNSIHMSPYATAHFWAWWRLFDGTMSLPIRQGKIFPNAPPPSKKFGKHLATIAYRFQLSPLFISHVYRMEFDPHSPELRSLHLGVKARIDSFQVEMHQRDQETTVLQKETGERRTIRHKPFYAVLITLTDSEIRAMCARFVNGNLDEVDHARDQEGDEFPEDQMRPAPDLALEMPDWIDLDDYVDLCADGKPRDFAPMMRLLPCGTCPRFSYSRRTRVKREGGLGDDGAEPEISKFGSEDVVAHDLHPITVQKQLAQARAEELRAALERLAEGGSAESSTSSLPSDDMNEDSDASLRRKLELLEAYIRHLIQAERNVQRGLAPPEEGYGSNQEDIHGRYRLPFSVAGFYEKLESFDNRYFCHNPTIFISNSVRNILLRYYQASRLRRGSEYQLAARAVHFIRNLVNTEDHPQARRSRSHRHFPSQGDPEAVRRLVNMLSNGGGNDRTGEHVVTDADVDAAEEGLPVPGPDQVPDPREGLSDEGFSVKESHAVVLMKPQIACRSELDDDSVIVLAAVHARLQTYSVRDETVREDPINSVVMHRNYVNLDGLQAFFPKAHRTEPATGLGQDYVPLETLIDLRFESQIFDRLVPQTSATLRYDKFNTLRMHRTFRPVANLDGKELTHNGHLRHYMDLIKVNVPRFSVSASSTHFAALYNVVTDLLLYRDPHIRERSLKLATFVYSYDFHNLQGMADVVESLQDRIRSLHELRVQYDLHADVLTESDQKQLTDLRIELHELTEELSLIFDAINQEASDQANKAKKPATLFEVRASELGWHMRAQDDALLAKLTAKGVRTSWLNNSDNSTLNTIVLQDFSALDSTPDALFSEIITKYNPSKMISLQYRPPKNIPFVRVSWSLLAPVGGISIVNSFDLELAPIKVQIEKSIGRRLMAYVFADRQARRELQFSSAQQADEYPASSSAPSVRSGKSGKSGRSALDRPERPRRVSHESASHLSVRSAGGAGGIGRLRRVASSDTLSRVRHEQSKDAVEMRMRASSNRTFVYVKAHPTTVILTYKSDRSSKSLLDLYDLAFASPTIQYTNLVGSFEDLFQRLKKDLLRSAWSQKGKLLHGILVKKKKIEERVKSTSGSSAFGHAPGPSFSSFRSSSVSSQSGAPSFPTVDSPPPSTFSRSTTSLRSPSALADSDEEEGVEHLQGSNGSGGGGSRRSRLARLHLGSPSGSSRSSLGRGGSAEPESSGSGSGSTSSLPPRTHAHDPASNATLRPTATPTPRAVSEAEKRRLLLGSLDTSPPRQSSSGSRASRNSPAPSL